jgi:hypothetical protein
MRQSISRLNTSNDVVCDKEVPFGCLIDEFFFYRSYLFCELFKGHLACKSKSRLTFEWQEIDAIGILITKTANLY